MNKLMSIAAAAALAATAVAQTPNEPKEPFRIEHDVIRMAPLRSDVTFERHAIAVNGADPVQFVSAEAGIGGKVVKGAPYSAESITESTQTLADGNRIVSKSSSFTYRDSEGRTRREMTLAVPGLADPPTIIMINDPVAGVSYHLDTKMKIARKLFTIPDVQSVAFGVANAVRANRTPAAAPGIVAAGATAVMLEGSGPAAAVRVRNMGEPKVEQLGKRAIDGVEAEGSRSTITIPAGQIGNERDILIVTERWYSPELQTPVLSKHSDPRMGETTYSLVNIKRADPHPSLFQVPSDYTLQNPEEGGPGVRVIRKRIEQE